MNEAGLAIPRKLAKKWVVDCTHVGKGKPALKYLSRYLYRGVINENHIVANQDQHVTFQYTESRTGKTRYRTLKGEDFLWLVLQHVLPKGFRRVRDYGFLHGNAKKLLNRVQLILQVLIDVCTQRMRPDLSVLSANRQWSSSLLPDRHGHRGKFNALINLQPIQYRRILLFMMSSDFFSQLVGSGTNSP